MQFHLEESGEKFVQSAKQHTEYSIRYKKGD